MQGLADYYDKHKPVTQDEQKDAIDTYTRLLTFVERYREIVIVQSSFPGPNSLTEKIFNTITNV